MRNNHGRIHVQHKDLCKSVKQESLGEDDDSQDSDKC